jgi:hypothetical protein
MKTRTQAIKEFLNTQAIKIDLYTPQMEVQVNVIPSNEKERDGKRIIYSDADHSWSAFRIPYASSGLGTEPHYKDKIQDWPIAAYAEGIGCTGWDWYNRVSVYVGFDFDSIVNHQKGLNDAELDELRLRVRDIPYVTLRRSKSGKGYHLYIKFTEPVPTKNHTEHAALAKAVLSNLSGLLDFDFQDKVDASGGVLWIWHRDASKEKHSFEIIKKATTDLDSAPKGWQEFLTVRKKRSYGRGSMDELISRTRKEKLDDEHRGLLNYLAKKETGSWWHAENHMLITHTSVLKRAHEDLDLRGVFDTISTGKDPHDHNCFCFPDRQGAWRVYRYTTGTEEHSYWSQSAGGWTSITFNRHPDLSTVSKMFKAKRTAKGSFIFDTSKVAFRALRILGIDYEVQPTFADRETTVYAGKSESEIILSFEYRENDSQPKGDWYMTGKPRRWEILLTADVEVKEIEPPDEIVRHVNIPGGDSKWFIHSRGRWVEKNKGDVKSAMLALEYSNPMIEKLIGTAVLEGWDEVVNPFDSEYPGDRQWNRNAPQLVADPVPGKHPTWDIVLEHIGSTVNPLTNEWCRVNGVNTGSQYLLLWIASLLRHPAEPLPYLFLFSRDQNTGKSLFHEAIQLLFKDGLGYTRADHALTNTSGFNGELHRAVLCVVEEVNVAKSKYASERIKDWVTGRQIYIRPLHQNGFNARNTTHWIQVANDENFCPVFPGDTRITAIHVSTIENEIPKPDLIARLKAEGPYFLHTLFSVEIPASNGRLRIPYIDSELKESIQDKNRNSLTDFIDDRCSYAPGWVTSFDMLQTQFQGWLVDEGEKARWSLDRTRNDFPVGRYVTGQYGRRYSIGNLYINDEVSKQVAERILIKDGRRIIEQPS